jgi:hypothetical protein
VAMDSGDKSRLQFLLRQKLHSIIAGREKVVLYWLEWNLPPHATQ